MMGLGETLKTSKSVGLSHLLDGGSIQREVKDNLGICVWQYYTKNTRRALGWDRAGQNSSGSEHVELSIPKEEV